MDIDVLLVHVRSSTCCRYTPVCYILKAPHSHFSAQKLFVSCVQRNVFNHEKICCLHNTYLPSGSNHEQLIVMGYLILKTVILEIGYGVERILGAASPLRNTMEYLETTMKLLNIKTT